MIEKNTPKFTILEIFNLSNFFLDILSHNTINNMDIQNPTNSDDIAYALNKLIIIFVISYYK